MAVKSVKNVWKCVLNYHTSDFEEPPSKRPMAIPRCCNDIRAIFCFYLRPIHALSICARIGWKSPVHKMHVHISGFHQNAWNHGSA